jgi:AP endonuclease-1
MCCESPESPARKESGPKATHKRNISNGTSELSPRRSKRQKSTANLKEQSDSEVEDFETEDTAPVSKEEEEDKPIPTNTAEKKKVPIKKEPKDGAQPRKARKSKKDQEAEMIPLAPRTKGLRMFVGAHVSAAKGQCLPISPRPAIAQFLSNRCLQLYTQQRTDWVSLSISRSITSSVVANTKIEEMHLLCS